MGINKGCNDKLRRSFYYFHWPQKYQWATHSNIHGLCIWLAAPKLINCLCPRFTGVSLQTVITFCQMCFLSNTHIFQTPAMYLLTVVIPYPCIHAADKYIISCSPGLPVRDVSIRIISSWPQLFCGNTELHSILEHFQKNCSRELYRTTGPLKQRHHTAVKCSNK